ncbi:hypothetical protein G7054_g13631 [Neopestalotiopsis clavispora]|nr:hypothetical protein G7054_g13631 [Neopestalotiopsis clavispora]
MDVPYKDPAFDDDDLDNVFVYEERQSQLIWKVDNNEVLNEVVVEDESDWSQWSEKEPFYWTEKSRKGLAVVVGSRAKEDHGHNSSILEYLPFSQDTFERLTGLWQIHGDIARVINRSDSVSFSIICFEDDGADNIYYNCRTSSKWRGDLAVSSTFERKRGFTKSIVFGCNAETTDAIAARIENFDGSFTHPLIVIGILVELERERHYKLVKSEVTGLLKRVYEISNNNTVSESPETHGQNISIDSWAKVSHLRTGLESWKKQLIKMIAHIDELECQLKRKPSAQTTHLEVDDTYLVLDSKIAVDTSEWHSGCIETGRRIKNRLVEILCEYEENIKDCTMVIDGVTLASQMVSGLIIQVIFTDRCSHGIKSDTRMPKLI